MAEVHSHSHGDEQRSSYYLDQLFTIGVCGAIAGVTIMLWMPSSGSLFSKFLQDVRATVGNAEGSLAPAVSLLDKILHQKFHIWVVLGGLFLLGIVFFRAVAVWRSVDEAPDTGEPHDHGAGCGHSHGHGEECGHSHA